MRAVRARPALPSIEEMQAMRMLMGDTPFVVCPECAGSGTVRKLFGRGRCRQCKGLKAVIMGPKLREALGIDEHEYFR